MMMVMMNEKCYLINEDEDLQAIKSLHLVTFVKFHVSF